MMCLAAFNLSQRFTDVNRHGACPGQDRPRNLPPGLAPGTYRTCLMDDTDPRALNQAKDQPPDDGLDRSNPLLRLGLASKPLNRSTPLGPSNNLNAHRQRKLVGHETSLSGAGQGRKSAQTFCDRIRLGVRIDPSARSSGGRYHRPHPFQPRIGLPLRRLRSSARIEA